MRRRDLIAAALFGSGAPVVHAAPKLAVLELFTSQGCSSCPPADALLGQLAKRPGIIALAWHVDYWDNLGWRDRFASRTATDRQRAYATRLGEGVFTPALLVNGAKMLVGSDRGSIEAAVAAAPPLPAQLSVTRLDDGLAVTIASTPGPLRAERIVYDAQHMTDVGAGENNGTRLREYRVVREIETLGEWDGAARQFVVKDATAGQGQAIVLRSGDLRVVGAADLRSG
jgi:hypothetical protein